MHFVWSLLLGKIINILQILQGLCKLLTSTIYDNIISILFLIFVKNQLKNIFLH